MSVPPGSPAVPPANGSRPLPSPGNSALASVSRLDFVRDGVAGALLLVALFYRWNFLDTAASKWWVDIATVMALAGVVAPYLGMLGVLGTAWQPSFGRLARLGAAAPYVLSLVALVLADIFTSDGYGADGGVGRAAYVGIFAIILVLQPREFERGGPVDSVEDRVWLWVTVGLLGLWASTLLISAAITIDDWAGASKVFFALSVLVLITLSGALAVAVARRIPAGVNLVAGVGMVALATECLGINTDFSPGLFGPLNYSAESVHLPFFGKIVSIAAAAAALAPGVSALVVRRTARISLRTTGSLALALLAGFSGVQSFVMISYVLQQSDYGSTPLSLVFIAVLSLAIAAVAGVAAVIGLQQENPSIVAIGAGVYALLSWVIALVAALSDQLPAGPGNWLIPPALAGLILVMTYGPGAIKSAAGSAAQTFDNQARPEGDEAVLQTSAEQSTPSPRSADAPPHAPATGSPAQSPTASGAAPESVESESVPEMEPEPEAVSAPAPEPEPGPVPEPISAPAPEPEQPAEPTSQFWGNPVSIDPTDQQPAVDPWRAKAQDPQTTPAELADLAAHQPHTRVDIAVHPQAYPGLLTWLSQLGDPEVDAALRRR